MKRSNILNLILAATNIYNGSINAMRENFLNLLEKPLTHENVKYALEAGVENDSEFKSQLIKQKVDVLSKIFNSEDSFSIEFNDTIRKIAVNSNGRHIAVATFGEPYDHSTSPAVTLLDISAFPIKSEAIMGIATVENMEFTADGSRLVIRATNREQRAWVINHRFLPIYSEQAADYLFTNGFIHTKDKKYAIKYGCYLLETNYDSEELPAELDSIDYAYCVAFSADEKYIVSDSYQTANKKLHFKVLDFEYLSVSQLLFAILLFNLKESSQSYEDVLNCSIFKENLKDPIYRLLIKHYLG